MKKIIAIVLAVAMTLCLSVSVAAEGKSAELGLYVGQWDGGAPCLGTITVTDEPAQYTITNEKDFSGNGKIEMIVFKTPAGNSELKNVKIKTVSITVDGVELQPKPGNTMEYTSDANGVFEILYKGGWTTANNEVDVPADLNYTAKSKLSITFIVDPDNYDPNAAAADDTPADAPADDTPADAPAADAPAADAPAADAPSTGIALAVVPAVVAMAAAFISKKH